MKYEIAADLINIIIDVIANASHKNSTFLEITHVLQRLKSLVKIPESPPKSEEPTANK